MKLNHGQADVVINWSGGLHHAKKAEVMAHPSAAEMLVAICGVNLSFQGLLAPFCDFQQAGACRPRASAMSMT